MTMNTTHLIDSTRLIIERHCSLGEVSSRGHSSLTKASLLCDDDVENGVAKPVTSGHHKVGAPKHDNARGSTKRQ